jgi:hypothetical protein
MTTQITHVRTGMMLNAHILWNVMRYHRLYATIDSIHPALTRPMAKTLVDYRYYRQHSGYRTIPINNPFYAFWR